MAFDFYFAGDQCIEADETIVKLNANRLLSYYNDKKKILDFFKYKKQGWQGKLMIDSGAFTAHTKGVTIDLDEYCSWLKTNDDLIDYAIELDQIPGTFGVERTKQQVIDAANISYENLLYIRKQVKNPSKILPVFHNGESMEHLARIMDLDNIDYICLSGSKDEPGRTMDPWLDECFKVIKSSRHPDVNIHLLGCTKFRYAEMYNLTSMDATSWIKTGSMGNILTPYGMVYVGNRSIVENQPKEFVDKLTEYLNSINLSLDDLVDSYKKRMIANIIYTYEQSKKVTFIGNTVRRRRLI